MLILKLVAILILTAIGLYPYCREIRRIRTTFLRQIFFYIIILLILASFFTVLTTLVDYNTINTIKALNKSVKTFTIKVLFEFPTIFENEYQEVMRIALGEYDIACLRSTTGQKYLFHSNEMTSTVATLSQSVRYELYYDPEPNSSILTKNIGKLRDIKYFICNYYTETLRDWTRWICRGIMV